MNFRRHKQPNTPEKAVTENLASNPFGYTDEDGGGGTTPTPTPTGNLLIFINSDGLTYMNEDGLTYGIPE